MPIQKLAALSVIFLLLGACTTVPKTPITQQNQTAWAQYQATTSQIENWDLRGRAVVLIDRAVHHVGLAWQQHAGRFLITLEAPFGQGAIRLETNPKSSLPVKLSLADGQIIDAETAEAALERVTGWFIPVSDLQFWIKGLPQQSSDFSYQLNGDGRLKSLQQNGWHIDYLSYFGSAEPGRGLPRKIYLKHNRLTLKIVIAHWQKPEVTSSKNQLFPDFN